MRYIERQFITLLYLYTLTITLHEHDRCKWRKLSESNGDGLYRENTPARLSMAGMRVIQFHFQRRSIDLISVKYVYTLWFYCLVFSLVCLLTRYHVYVCFWKVYNQFTITANVCNTFDLIFIRVHILLMFHLFLHKLFTADSACNTQYWHTGQTHTHIYTLAHSTIETEFKTIDNIELIYYAWSFYFVSKLTANSIKQSRMDVCSLSWLNQLHLSYINSIFRKVSPSSDESPSISYEHSTLPHELNQLHTDTSIYEFL